MPQRQDFVGRQGLVLGNLLKADPAAATRAFFSPESLSPEEAQTLRDQLGLSDGLFSFMFDAVTNPITLLGIALSMKFPIPRLVDMQKMSAKVARISKTNLLPPFLREAFQSPFTIFGDRLQVPRALADASFSRQSFMRTHYTQLADAMGKFEKSAGRKLTARDWHLVVLNQDGLLKSKPVGFKNFARPGVNPKTGKSFARGSLRTPINKEAVEAAFTPELRAFNADVRKMFNGAAEDIFIRDPKMKEELTRALTRRDKKLSQKQITDILEEQVQVPDDVIESLKKGEGVKKLQADLVETGLVEPGSPIEGGFWHHTMTQDMADYESFVQQLMETAKGDVSTLGKIATAGVEKVVAPATRKRKNLMLPSPDDLRAFPEFLDEAAMLEFETVAADSAVARSVRQYSLNPDEVIPRYLSQMGSTFGFNKQGNGRILVEASEQLIKEGDTFRGSLLQNTLIPMVAGKSDLARSIKSQYWMGVQKTMKDFIDSPTMGKTLGPKLQGWMSKNIAKDSGPFSAAAFDDKIAEMLHLSTLGANVGASAVNLTQTLATTLPLLGAADTFRGVRNTLRGVPKYFDARKVGKDHLGALGIAFPDFAEAGLGGSIKFGELAGQQLDKTYRMAQAGPLKRGIEKTKEAMMSFFQGTEAFNQLVAFEGTMIKAGREGFTKQFGRNKSIQMAREIVLRTQFPVGPENSSVLMSKLKGMPGGKLMTMFLQFPLKSLEFATSTATQLGSGAPGIVGRNWGTLGRAAIVAGVGQEIGEAAGIDFSRALLFGALPEAREGDAFFPFPFVPPAVSIAGAVATDVLTGSFDKTRRVLPLFVPGGVAASRLVGYASPETAQLLGRKFVDYNQPAPDGRYAVMSSPAGQAPTLVGFQTPAQLIMKGLGLPGLGEADQEVAAMKFLVANRERIREFKRDYLGAMLGNNPKEMNRVAGRFSDAYPDIAGGLPNMVSKQDVRAVQLRRNVTRMERILATLPEAVRPIFARAIQASVLGSGPGFLGIDPGLLSTGTPLSRRGGNVQSSQSGFRPGGGLRQPVDPNAGGGGFQRSSQTPQLGAVRNTSPSELGRAALPNVSGFEGF